MWTNGLAPTAPEDTAPAGLRRRWACRRNEAGQDHLGGNQSHRLEGAVQQGNGRFPQDNLLILKGKINLLTLLICLPCPILREYAQAMIDSARTRLRRWIRSGSRMALASCNSSCHSSKGEAQRLGIMNEGDTGILRRLRLLRMTVRQSVFGHAAQGSKFWARGWKQWNQLDSDMDKASRLEIRGKSAPPPPLKLHASKPRSAMESAKR